MEAVATETTDAIIAAAVVMVANGGTEAATTVEAMTGTTNGSMVVTGEVVVAVVGMTSGNVKRLTVAVSLVEMNLLQVSRENRSLAFFPRKLTKCYT